MLPASSIFYVLFNQGNELERLFWITSIVADLSEGAMNTSVV